MRFQLIKALSLFTGSSIERLCDVAASDPTGYAQLDDRGPMVRAARALLGSVTRVLLLADIVVVKQLLLAKDRVRLRVSRSCQSGIYFFSPRRYRGH